MTLRSDQFTFVMSYELVKDTKPQAVKLTILESPFGAGQRTNGILELKNDTLKLCYPPMGGDIPTKFDGKSGSGRHYFVLKRAPENGIEKMVGAWGGSLRIYAIVFDVRMGPPVRSSVWEKISRRRHRRNERCITHDPSNSTCGQDGPAERCHR